MTPLLSLILINCLAVTLGADSEPTGILLLIRHGARGILSPTYDRNNTWKDQYGELTAVGMRQQFLHGLYINQKYPELFKKYNPKKIYVRSTDFNRTIMSGQSLTFGFFKGSGPVFDSGYNQSIAFPPYPTTDLNLNFTDLSVLPDNYQPLPIHVVEYSKDELLQSFGPTCPKAYDLVKQQVDSSDYKAFFANYADILNEMKETLNITGDVTYRQISDTFDALAADSYNHIDFPYPITHESELGKKVKFLFEYLDYFKNAGTPLQRQLYSMNLLNQFQNDIEAILNNSSTIIRLYSAHDSTLVPVLAALGIASHECILENYKAAVENSSCYFPQFASAIRIEIWKNETDIDSSRIKIFFDSREQNLCKDDQGCTLAAFRDLVHSITQGKGTDFYRSTCNSAYTTSVINPINNTIIDLPQEDKHNGIRYTVYALFGLAGLLLVGIVGLWLKLKDIDREEQEISLPVT